MSRFTRVLTIMLLAMSFLSAVTLHAYSPLGDPYGVIVDDPTTVTDAFPIIAEARFGWARLFAYWQIMEPAEGSRSFTYLDAQVNAAIANGLKVEIVFASIPGWANGTPANCGLFTPACAVPPTNNSFFSSFVSAVVTHYGTEVGYYEIWNEPNYSNFWNGTNTQFINDILIPGAAAVHAASATAKTVGPASSQSFSYFEGAVSSACGSLDVLSSHFFGSPAGTESPATMFADLDTNYKPYILAHCNKPLWVTAWEDDSALTSEATQATYIASAIEGLPSRSYLDKLFLYRWVDVSEQPLVAPGLVGVQASGYRRKPSFAAAQAAILGTLGQPGVATAPSPVDKAATVPLGTTLSWTAGTNAVMHKVYFGTTSLSLLGEQAGTSFVPPPETYSQKYTWRIDEVDSGGDVTTGTTWTFTTAQNPSLPQVDIVVQADPNAVYPAGAYYLTVVQGAATPSYSPFVAATTSGPSGTDDLWTVVNHQGTGFNFFTAAPTESPSEVTVSIGGLTDGAVYDVYGRYGTAPAATGNGVTMGLNPAELTTYDQSFLDHQVTRMFGAWQEYEVALGPATVTNGAVNLTISNASLSSSANWSGVRLSIPISAPVPYRFYTITPCRVVDTRLTGVPFTQSSPQQVFQVTGECGIPANAHAVAANVTLVSATASLDVQGYPGDLAPQGTNTVSATLPEQATVAGFAVLPLATSASGMIGFFMTLEPPATSGQTDLLLDVSGYFAP